MSKTFMEEVREYKKLYENSLDTTREDTADDIVDLYMLKQKISYASAGRLIAIDDIINQWLKDKDLSDIMAMRKVRQILVEEHPNDSK